MGSNFSSEPKVEKDTERAQNDTFNCAVSSCQGWRVSQEDNHSLILDLPGEHKASFFAVYDGHGSARVSKHASEGLWRHLTENEMYIKGDFAKALEEAFLTFDHEVNESYNAQLAGTTAICVLIVDNVIYCANIGDSRAVASVNCECIPLSHDHKPDNPQELKRIIAAGGYVLGNRVNGNLALSRAFGDFYYKGNKQLPQDQQIVSPCPDIKRIELNDDVDFVVLACDGIWDVLSNEEVVRFVISRLEQDIEPGLICEQLTTKCIATDYELVIGCDNMTVLLVCYTRGRSWSEYCTDIFNKNTKRLGVPNRARYSEIDQDEFGRSDPHSKSQTTTSSSSASSSSPFIRGFTTPSSTSSSTNSFDEFGSERQDSTGNTDGSDRSVLDMSDREMRFLIDVLSSVEQSHRSNNSSSASNNNDTANNTTNPDEPASSSQPSNEVPTDNKDDDDAIEKSTAQQKTSDDNSEPPESARQDATQTATTEIHLSSPDDAQGTTAFEETTSAAPPDEVPQGDANADIDTVQSQDTAAEVANTIEIELASPDEEYADPIGEEEATEGTETEADQCEGTSGSGQDCDQDDGGGGGGGGGGGEGESQDSSD